MTPRSKRVGFALSVAVAIVALLVLLSVCLRPPAGEGASGQEGVATLPSQESPGEGGEEGSSSSGQRLWDDAGDEGSVTRGYSSELDLVDEASRLLEGYEDEGSCLLREAGYLDLFGNVWSCTVQGPGWVEVCVVSQAEGTGSEVKVVRMGIEEWERSYGNE